MVARHILISGILLFLISGNQVISQDVINAIIQVDSTSGSAPLYLNFDGSQSSSDNGEIVSYHWDFGDGTESDGVTVFHRFDKSGIYGTILTVTDEASQSANDAENINVGPSPPRAIAVLSSHGGIAPFDINYDASRSVNFNGENLQYMWDFGDGNLEFERQGTHQYFNPGRYTIILRVTDETLAVGYDTTFVNVYDPLPDITSFEDGYDKMKAEVDSLNGAIISAMKFWSNDFADTSFQVPDKYLRNASIELERLKTYAMRATIISYQVDSLASAQYHSQMVQSKDRILKKQSSNGFFSGLAKAVNKSIFGIFQSGAGILNARFETLDPVIRDILASEPSVSSSAKYALETIAGITTNGEWDALTAKERKKTIDDIYTYPVTWFDFWSDSAPDGTPLETYRGAALKEGAKHAGEAAKHGLEISIEAGGVPYYDNLWDVGKDMVVLKYPDYKTHINILYKSGSAIIENYPVVLQQQRQDIQTLIDKVTSDSGEPNVDETNYLNFLRSYVSNNEDVSHNTISRSVNVEAERLASEYDFADITPEGDVNFTGPKQAKLTRPQTSQSHESVEGYSDMLSLADLSAVNYQHITLPDNSSDVFVEKGNADQTVDLNDGQIQATNPYPTTVLEVSGTLNNNTVWTPYGGVYKIVNHITVDDDAILTIQPGTIIKFNSSYAFSINGTLDAQGTSQDSIVITSIKDDLHGGDTNNDGNATTPAPSDWGTINFYSGGSGLFDNVIVQYGGKEDGQSNSRSIIYCENSSPTITNSRIAHTVGDNSGPGSGIRCAGAASAPQINGNTITDCSYGVWATDLAYPILNYNNITSNLSQGIYNATSSVNINAENNWWGNSSGPLDDSDDRSTGGLYNPEGQGDRVSNYVDYDPWLDQPYSLPSEIIDEENVSDIGNYQFNEPSDGGDGHDIQMTFTNLVGSGSITVQQTNAAPTNAPCCNVCNYYWDISKDAAITSFSADITFHYTNSDATGYTESAAFFGIAKFNSSTNTWQWLGGAVDAENNTVTVTGVTSFSTFALFRRIFGDINGDGYVDAADLQRLGDCWHATNSGEFAAGSDAQFFNFNKNTDGSNQIIDAADLQVFGDCWHNGEEP